MTLTGVRKIIDHEAIDQLGRPTVTADSDHIILTHVVRMSVRYHFFENLAKSENTGGTVHLAK